MTNAVLKLCAAEFNVGNIRNGSFIGRFATALTTGRITGRPAAIFARSRDRLFAP
jgi:hypothetical protein